MSIHSNRHDSDDEYDSDEPPRLELDLNKLMEIATKSLRATCISATKLTKGSFHEIFTLRFEESDGNHPESLARSGFTCLARLARMPDALAKEESEIATIRYLKKHTKLPIPEIYYHDLSPYNDVGAPFSLMEKLPGRHLYSMWDDLSIDHKKKALSSVASIIVQLSSLRFDKIGSLTEDGFGPIINPCLEPAQGPFNSTVEYLRAFVSPDVPKDPKLANVFREIQQELDVFMSRNEIASLQSPFVIIHGDLDGQNMLFVDAPDGSGPMLTGLIDFEFSHTGPRYFLYEYPIFIQDCDMRKELYVENAVLRSHFVFEIFNQLPTAEEKQTFIACINSKNFPINSFRDTFMAMKCPEDMLIRSGGGYLKELLDGSGNAYSGRIDYVPEYYSEQGLPITIEEFQKLQKSSEESATFIDRLFERISRFFAALVSWR